MRDPWFYRVTAVNSCGSGRATMAWFFQREGNGSGLLMPVPVRPGLRVNTRKLEPREKLFALPQTRAILQTV